MKYPDGYINQVICGDCLEVMKGIPDKIIDMILCDLPYGTTACSWDTIIPFELLWKQYKRIIKDNGAMVLTASQPFTGVLVMSNIKMFRHGWIYKKRCASNFTQAKYSPMKEHEDVLVFGKNRVNYYPIKEVRKGSGSERAKYKYTDASRKNSGEFVGKMKRGAVENDSGNEDLRFPSSVQEFNNRAVGDRGFHPTQKPVALFEYLIKTYTVKSDLVLDNCIGSGTTAVACVNLNRRFIGIDIEMKYCVDTIRRLKAIPKSLFK